MRRFGAPGGAGAITLALLALALGAGVARADECRVLNVPRLDPKPEAERTWIADRHVEQRDRSAIAWLGKSGKNDNYAEVRAIYDADGIDLSIHVADLHLWFILTDGFQYGGVLRGDPLDWDAIDVAIDPTPEGSQPSAHALRVAVGDYQYNDPVAYPATALPHAGTQTWVGGAGAWTLVGDAEGAGHVWYHTVTSSWSSTPGPNDNFTDVDDGTVYTLFIPWASFGISEPPSGGTLKMLVTVHDVDDPRDTDALQPPTPSSGDSKQVGPLPPTSWPDAAKTDDPSTWGTLVMHQAPYAAPAVASETTIEITPDDVPYMDVTVGGHAFDLQRWTDGGGDPADFARETCMDTKFSARPDLVVHPEGSPANLCLMSRALLFFDLAGVVPPGDAVTHADLVTYHFGGDNPLAPGAPGFDAATSSVQVHRLERAWTDAPLRDAVTWNTAPFAAENVGFGKITPDTPAGENGKVVTFDVTPLVARAVARSEPLDLALYGADTGTDTGKYLVSREGGFGGDDHPKLRITHGPALDPSTLPTAESCTIGVAASLFDPPGTGSPSGPIPPVPTESAGGAGGSGSSTSSSGSGGAAPPKTDDGCGCRLVDDAPGVGARFALISALFGAGMVARRSRRRRR